jgi:hypothetical protein
MMATYDLALRRTLELASVEFIDENGGGPEVRTRLFRWSCNEILLSFVDVASCVPDNGRWYDPKAGRDALV